MKKAVESTGKGVSGFREVVQDALVPELREINTQIAALKDELRLRTEHLAQQDENIRQEVRTGLASLHEEIRNRDASLREELRLRDAALARDNKALSEKLDFALNIRERIIALESRSTKAE